MRTVILGVLGTVGLLASCGAVLGGCAAKPLSSNERTAMASEAQVALDDLEKVHPGVRRRMESAYAYAIFPRVTKGAAIVGGAKGDGLVYERGRLIGNVTLTQASVGAQIGGSSFRELILFQDRRALQRLIDGRMEFDARAQAVAGESGGVAANDYDDGVRVYTATVGGLILDASIGGQDFSYLPID